eukprot:1691278-Amphidinium_carterae.1
MLLSKTPRMHFYKPCHARRKSLPKPSPLISLEDDANSIVASCIYRHGVKCLQTRVRGCGYPILFVLFRSFGGDCVTLRKCHTGLTAYGGQSGSVG